jgi:hypothetical protein
MFSAVAVMACSILSYGGAIEILAGPALPRACRKISVWCEVDIQPLLTKGRHLILEPFQFETQVLIDALGLARLANFRVVAKPETDRLQGTAQS